MSCYLLTQISGNESFGGYISIDGGKSFPVVNGEFYPISPGQHTIMVYSKSDASRKSGQLQSTVYKNTSPSGVVFDSLSKASALSATGDAWQINLYVEDGQCAFLSVNSKGSKLIGDPLYRVDEVDPEDLRKMDETHEAWLNTPTRSKKGMIWGIVLVLCGIISRPPDANIAERGVMGYVMCGVFLILGIFIFISGFKLKIRRK